MAASKNPYQRKRIVTKDGSHTFEIKPKGETYHSRHGAVQESTHVFINHGVQAFLKPQAVVRVLEVGFGTGLNALLTLEAIAHNDAIIAYTALEPHPFTIKELSGLNYTPENSQLTQLFHRFHEAIEGESTAIVPRFSFTRLSDTLQEFEVPKESFEVVYYDAFAPNTQPELWKKSCFDKIFHLLAVGGCMVTYCAKGQVRRDLKAAGFDVERLDGPPGKREMLRAWKRK